MAILDYSALSNNELIDAYENAAAELWSVIGGMTRKEILARVTPGKWSTLEVICHIADFEILNAERIRRVLTEDEPILFNGEPDDFERALAYTRRDTIQELTLIGAIRGQTGRILRWLPEDVWQRSGIHNTDGPLTLRQLIERVTKHIPHHVAFIRDKRVTLKGQG